MEKLQWNWKRMIARVLVALSLIIYVSLNDTFNLFNPWFLGGFCGILSLKEVLQRNKSTITVECHKHTIKSNSSAEDYVQMLDGHLTVPTGLINRDYCVLAIAVNCLKQGRRKIRQSLLPHYPLQLVCFSNSGMLIFCIK